MNVDEASNSADDNDAVDGDDALDSTDAMDDCKLPIHRSLPNTNPQTHSSYECQ